MPTVPFTNFADGEYGALSPFGTGFAIYRSHLLYKGWWHGQNVFRTIDGGLCPRAGMKAYTLTGVANGALGGMGYSQYTPQGVWFAVGSAVYRFDPGSFVSQAVTPYVGALAGYSEPLTFGDWLNHTYVSCYSGGGIFLLDHVAATVTTVAGSPSGFATAVYGDRLLTAAANRVYYSAAGDFSSWPANNYFDVGHNANVTSMVELRTRLAISKDSSNGGTTSWYNLSGVPGFNDVLRSAEANLAPNWAPQAVNMGAGLGFVNQAGNLAIFDGSQVNEMSHLKVLNSRTHTGASAFRLRHRGEWGFATDHTVDANDSSVGSIWAFRNGAWSRHKRDVTSAANTGGLSASLTTDLYGYIIFGQDGDGSHPPTFAAWNAFLERPPFTSDAGTSILDPATVSVTLPEYWDRSGNDISVSAVLVDFRSYNTGDSNPCTFTITPTAMRTFNSAVAGGNNDSTDSAPVTFTAATSNFSTSGTRCREHMKFSGSWGNGFRIDISNMRGIIIDKLVVVYDQRPPAGI